MFLYVLVAVYWLEGESHTWDRLGPLIRVSSLALAPLYHTYMVHRIGSARKQWYGYVEVLSSQFGTESRRGNTRREVKVIKVCLKYVSRTVSRCLLQDKQGVFLLDLPPSALTVHISDILCLKVLFGPV